jgi:uncharacterized protein YyaL (SSP411 family)
MLLVAVRAVETSPLASAPTEFTRAQAASPIRWQPWTEAVLAQAKQQNKSVYVFIGSPLSELTRATISQTFTSEKTVTWINENFFCIFVDADAQPDVAALGQHFINAVKQLRGSPVHLWLTPDTLQPYDGANYLPPSEEWGKPGFLKAARAALDTWTVDQTRARALAAEAIEMMRLPPVDPSAKIDIEAKLAAAAKAWTAAIDPVNGGFGSAPKLPEPELIRFLLTRDGPAREAALNAARALVNGALRDPVDGGFYRRCIDDQWKEPYHQKLLVDQARIALALFEAADVAKDEKLRAAGIGALDFVLKELRNPDGTFAAALDGTLEENPDPVKRPKFIRVGQASLGVQYFVAEAMFRAKEAAKNRAAHSLVALLAKAAKLGGYFPHFPGQSDETPAMAADYLARSVAVRWQKDTAGIAQTIANANHFYFDESSGAYMASSVKLPMGIAMRAPASGDTPSAEVLALLAGVDAKTADLIRRNLMTQIEYDELPPGDILLGLSQGQK